jgi:2-iminobutanoate/2-iminopropanoate deaminase
LFHEPDRNFRKETLLIANHAARIALVIAAASLSACSAPGSRIWVPQGPGGALGSDAPTEARAPAQQSAQAPAPAAPQVAPARRFDIDPALVAQTPPPQQAGAAQPRAAAPLPTGGYTQATRYGDLLFVSGQIGMDLKTNEMRGTTIEDQTRQAMENIRAVLEAHRLTMANVVSVTVYMKDLGHFRGMDSVYETFFRSNLPARSVVQVARLPRDGLVEISVIAGR